MRVGPRQAEITANIDLKVAGRDLSLVEWEITSPRPFVVSSVSGPAVGPWCQSGTRLLVWLEKTTGSTRIHVTGWLPLTLTMKGKKAIGQPLLELPCFRIPSAKVNTQLTLTAAPGFALTPKGKPLSLVPQGKPSQSELRYAAQQAYYGGSFVVKPGLAPLANVRTEASLHGKELTFTATIDYRLQGELRTVGLRLRDWEGDAELTVPAGSVARRRELTRRTARSRERTWTLDLAPGVRDHYRLVLRGRVPLEEAGEGVLMPDVVVVGARAVHTLLMDETLAAEDPIGLTPTAAPPGRRPACSHGGFPARNGGCGWSHEKARGRPRCRCCWRSIGCRSPTAGAGCTKRCSGCVRRRRWNCG